ncbi:MAG TPA: DoxX family protein [Flavisolibacter sp.]|nr:DoxX family protein [Flavisolibacter sp.]
MNAIQRIEHWGETHHPRYLDIVRIALGVFLIIKGVEFANNSNTLSALLSRQIPFSGFLLLLLTHYIIFAHIAGGFLVAVGLLTRLACMVQIPILVGALIMVNWDVTEHFGGMLLALFVLALLVLFSIVGSGPWSLERAFEKTDR